MNVLRAVPVALGSALLLWIQLGWVLNWFGYNTYVWLNLKTTEVCVGTAFHALHLSYGPPIPWDAGGPSYAYPAVTGELSHLGPLTISIERVPTPAFLLIPEGSFDVERSILNTPEWLAALLLAAPLLAVARRVGAERVAAEEQSKLQ